MMERPARNKQSSRNLPNNFGEFVTDKPFQLRLTDQSYLLGRFVSYEESEVL
jgi:hypothetical protein